MIDLTPLETLYETKGGTEIALPPDLMNLYGRLWMKPGRVGQPRVISNFVSTLDGVVSLNLPGHSGGSEISGFNRHDRMVMGLLRSVADAIVVGAGTLRAVPHHVWTAEYIFPSLSEAYQQLRKTAGNSEKPLNVVVSGRGEVDLDLPVFRSADVRAMIVTTEAGSRQLLKRSIPSTVVVKAVPGSGSISAHQVLDAIEAAQPSTLVLVEGGPRLLGDFLAERFLDDLFLTLAPQIAGRSDESGRPGLVLGKTFAPANPIWGVLASLKRANDHLFLRYRLPRL